jgi:hypothetical protein
MRFLRRRYGEYIPGIDGGAGVALKKYFPFLFAFLTPGFSVTYYTW